MELTTLNEALVDDLNKIFRKHQIKSDELQREIFSRDASYFNLSPQVVVQPESVDQVIDLIKLLPKHNQHVTFRSGGTSLSGQSVGDGIICDLRTAWKGFEIRDRGQRIWFEPGLTCQQVNQILESYKYRLGPDPASHRAAMMGGILANNSSGMQAGTRFNSYQMITAIEFVLANGHHYVSDNINDRKRFEQDEKEICRGLMEIRNKIINNSEIKQRIVEKYKIKNVTGYGMNSFVDYDNPMDILAHLLIGSEGTLAFIVSAEQNTLPLYNYYTSSMFYFKDVTLAAAAVPSLASTPALSVEMMDFASLQSVVGNPMALPELAGLPLNSTALLVDFGANTQEELNDIIGSNSDMIKKLDGMFMMDPFTRTVEDRAKFWKIRDGIFPCVAGARIPGDTVILEDVVAPVDHLYDLVSGIQNLFGKYNYKGSIFGHARDGDLHPLVTSGMQDAQHIEHFGNFMEEFVSLVLSLNGSLKGEHGTGRAVAPFVEREWGPEIYALMRDVKTLLDPENRLNPDVIISSNPRSHLENVKEMTLFGEDFHYQKADKCIECGFCEHVCPSRYLSFTPRHRIQARRVIKATKGTPLSAKLEKEYVYPGRDTCAADGMCRELCPMQINVADLTDEIRFQTLPDAMRSTLTRAANDFKGTEKLITNTLKLAIDSSHYITSRPLEWALSLAHDFTGQVPHWSDNFTKPPRFKPITAQNPEYIYFPACVTRIFGPKDPKSESLMDIMILLARKAGICMTLPEDAQGLCCSQIWQHKGDFEGERIMANKVIEHFWIWSAGGKIPIICDTTSCTHTMVNHLINEEGDTKLTAENVDHYKQIKIIDVTEWLCDVVLPKLTIKNKKERVLLHPTCACEEMGLTPKMKKVAEACANKVVIPEYWGCCGASGDRSFLYPELGETATKYERIELAGQQFDGRYSLARTCEINLENNLSHPFEPLAFLVWDAVK